MAIPYIFNLTSTNFRIMANADDLRSITAPTQITVPSEASSFKVLGFIFSSQFATNMTSLVQDRLG